MSRVKGPKLFFSLHIALVSKISFFYVVSLVFNISRNVPMQVYLIKGSNIL